MYDEDKVIINKLIEDTNKLLEIALKNAQEIFKDSQKLEINKSLLEDVSELDNIKQTIESYLLKYLLADNLCKEDILYASQTIKITSSLHKIWFHINDITGILLKIRKKNEFIDELINIMFEFTIDLLNNSIKSILFNDFDLAYSVTKQNLAVDELFKKTKVEIVNLINDESYVNDIMETLMVAKFLQCICDEIKAAAELIIDNNQ